MFLTAVSSWDCMHQVRDVRRKTYVAADKHKIDRAEHYFVDTSPEKGQQHGRAHGKTQERR